MYMYMSTKSVGFRKETRPVFWYYSICLDTVCTVVPTTRLHV